MRKYFFILLLCSSSMMAQNTNSDYQAFRKGVLVVMIVSEKRCWKSMQNICKVFGMNTSSSEESRETKNQNRQ